MSTEPSITELISSLEELRYQAMQSNALENIQRLLHPELSYVHSSGKVDNRDSFLKNLREGLSVYHRIQHVVHKVYQSGNTAIVFGEMVADITSHGVAKTIQNRTLNIWLKTGTNWQLFAYQPTPIATGSSSLPVCGE
ncbi:nuclear transport factor 2 family protein [Pseudomonas moorei]|uniref:nuclear transport factor 2 family protein n=1 Tax=Pseudomonas moorei TaxID=395599 RepID=UPI001FF507FD|nr:nuclear transport factor 2 family protein [Pseudomonas moorei]